MVPFLQLDENIPLESLEKCILSFKNFYSTHLAEEQIDNSTLISDLCRATASANDCIVADTSRLLSMIKVRFIAKLAYLRDLYNSRISVYIYSLFIEN